jgi:hypothetical protein
MFLLLGLAAGLTAVTSGCMRTVHSGSVADRKATRDQDLDFWQGLETRRTITNHDALHGLLLLTAPKEWPSGYAARLQEAAGRGWIDEGEALPANESARVGLVAVATCELLGLEGGLTMRIVGSTQRYATRELVFRELIPDRTAGQALSGLEFIQLVGSIADRMDEADQGSGG